MYEVTNHRINDIWYNQTSNFSEGRTITPKFIVLHYTTGWSARGNRDWLLGAAGGSSNSGSSAHAVIGRDGEIWQICDFNLRAWHAGPSKFGTEKSLNSSSIGIEFVNPGWFKKQGVDTFVDYHQNTMTRQQLDDLGGFIEEPHPKVGSGVYAWPNYESRQLAMGRELVAALCEAYDIQAIVSHEEIDTRGWKTDPGPCFPFDSFRDILEDRFDGDTSYVYKVSASRLNFRGGPNANAELITPPGHLTYGTRVRRLAVDGRWFFVEATNSKAMRGWVHSRYLDRIWN